MEKLNIKRQNGVLTNENILKIANKVDEIIENGGAPVKVITITTGSGTLTDSQLNELISNIDNVIKYGTRIYRFYHETGTSIYYACVEQVSGVEIKNLNFLVINKNTKVFASNEFVLQNQPLTISNINTNVSASIAKASIINGVLYITFRGITTDALSGTFVLCKINGLPTISENIGFAFKKTASTMSFGFLRVSNGNIEIETPYASGLNVEFTLSILL